MKVHVIGCAGSFAGPHSAASCYLVEHEDADGRVWRVLLDLGSGAFGPLQSVIDPASLDAVVISHLHPDHYLDLTGLEVFWAYNSRSDLHKLSIYAPVCLPERIRAVMDRARDVPDGAASVPFRHHPVHDGLGFDIGPIHVEARAVTHPVEAYGFRLTAGEEVLAYSGDTDACTALDELALGSDLLLCEAGYIEGRDDHFTGVHLTGKRAGEAAARAGARQLVLTHIPTWTDPAVPAAEARETYDGPISMAAPLDTLDVAPSLRTEGTR